MNCKMLVVVFAALLFISSIEAQTDPCASLPYYCNLPFLKNMHVCIKCQEIYNSNNKQSTAENANDSNEKEENKNDAQFDSATFAESINKPIPKRFMADNAENANEEKGSNMDEDEMKNFFQDAVRIGAKRWGNFFANSLERESREKAFDQYKSQEKGSRMDADQVENIYEELLESGLDLRKNSLDEETKTGNEIGRVSKEILRKFARRVGKQDPQEGENANDDQFDSMAIHKLVKNIVNTVKGIFGDGMRSSKETDNTQDKITDQDIEGAGDDIPDTEDTDQKAAGDDDDDVSDAENTDQDTTETSDDIVIKDDVFSDNWIDYEDDFDYDFEYDELLED